jgi:hypothetical protein
VTTPDRIQSILGILPPDEAFFSIDEYGLSLVVSENSIRWA